LSNMALSEPDSSMTGRIFAMSAPKRGDSSAAWRALMALMFLRRVLISPLCEIMRKGWARGQDGKVFVL